MKTENIEISKSKIKNGDVLESLRFLFYADKERFKEVFDAEEFDFDVEPEEELKSLAVIEKSGDDLKGVVNLGGEPARFSVRELMNQVRVRHNVLDTQRKSGKLILKP